MARIHVNVGQDHIKRISKTNPLAAIEELIWNALDSNSKRVEVILHMNDMGGVQDIEIIDSGTGIKVDELENAFGNLGESKKTIQKETDDGRLLHGREGRGRFKALSLSNTPTWETIYKDDGKHYKYQISISYLDPDYYTYTNLQEVSVNNTGTRVYLENITQGERSLCRDDVPEKLTRKFALYLCNYPSIQILFDGKLLRVDDIINCKKKYRLELPDPEASKDSTLTVIEWKYKCENQKLHLCNEAGFSRHEMPSGVRASGVEYTAYLSSPAIEKYYLDGLIVLENMHPDLKNLINLSKEKLRDHLRQRLSEEADEVVKQWKELDIYPYEKETENPIEKAEREVFNIVAVRVNEHHPTFKKLTEKIKNLFLL